MKLQFVMDTSVDEDSKKAGHSTRTNGELTFPDGTPQWLALGYLSYCKVKLQGQFRRAKGGIPKTWKGDAEKYAPGTREVAALLPPAEQATVSFSQMTREQQREFLKAQAERLEAEELAELEKETNPE